MENAEMRLSQLYKTVNTWDMAISDAEAMIQEAKDRIAALKKSV